MSYLRLYLTLSVALTPAFAAAATDVENRGIIAALVAIIVGYIAAVMLGAAVLRRFRGAQPAIQA